MMKLSNVPLSVFNRALDLYSLPREQTVEAAYEALASAEGRKDTAGPIAPFARAIAEYLSLSGPWNENDGEFAGEGGYELELT